MKQIIECVPNYSEGRDRSVIDRIVEAIASGDPARAEKAMLDHLMSAENHLKEIKAI